MKLTRLTQLGAFVLFGASFVAQAHAQADPTFKFNDTNNAELTDTASQLNKVIKFSFYVMYLIGGLMLASSGFKLKAGDMPGFYKMAAGGVVVFLSPFLIKGLTDIGNSAQ